MQNQVESFRPYEKPHYIEPHHRSAHLILCYRNFQCKNNEYSHIGLGVNCILTAKMLRANRVRCDVVPVWDYDDVVKTIQANPTVTHLVIEAPFLPNGCIVQVVNQYPNVEFACRCHSQIAFLQVEAGAIALIRDYIRLQDTSLNFHMAVNSDRMGTILEQLYGSSCLLLPNLYYMDNPLARVWHAPAKLLKIGSFGAIRLMKNAITAGAAAMMLASTHKKDLQFYLSVAREEQSGGVLQAISNMFAGVPYASLIKVPWTNWSDFKGIIGNLDLHVQLSMSETFNITSADACAMGVPTVASEAIDWVPSSWVAQIDDAADVARTGWALLNDPHAGQRGIASLNLFNKQALEKWLAWLDGNSRTMPGFHLS